MLAVVCSGVGTALPPVALACDPGRSNDYPSAYWAGWTRDNAGSGNWKEVQADIEEIDPFVYTVSGAGATDNGGYTWVMLDAWGTWYDQIGSFKDNNKVRHILIAYNAPSTNGEVDWLFSPEPAGSTTTYKIHHVGVQYYFNYANGTDIFDSPVTFTQNGAQAASELHTKADQLPGSTSNHEGLTNATVTNTSGTSQDFDGTVSTIPASAPSWEHVYKASTKHLETWDGNC